MALIKCPECGKEVSSKAKTCPNCGMPISELYGPTIVNFELIGFKWSCFDVYINEKYYETVNISKKSELYCIIPPLELSYEAFEDSILSSCTIYIVCKEDDGMEHEYKQFIGPTFIYKHKDATICVCYEEEISDGFLFDSSSGRMLSQGEKLITRYCYNKNEE